MFITAESMAGGGRKEKLKSSASSKMGEPSYRVFMESENGNHHREDPTKSSPLFRLRLWRYVKPQRHRDSDLSRSISLRGNCDLEFEHSTAQLIKEQDIVIERIITLGNPAFSASKRRSSRRIWNLKHFLSGSGRSAGCSGGNGGSNDKLPSSSYAKLYSSSSPDKEKKRALGEKKVAQKKKTVSQTVCISSPNRKGVPISAHELHYISNRAQAEELRRKTLLPYRQGVLACLGFPKPPAQGVCFNPSLSPYRLNM